MVKFEPRAKNVQNKLKRHTNANSLYCINSEAAGSIPLYGDSNVSKYSFIDVMAIPCGQKETEIGAERDRIREDCNWDREAAVDYFRDLNILILKNKDKLHTQNFDLKERVSKHTNFEPIRADEANPHYFRTYIQKQVIDDETSLLQLG